MNRAALLLLGGLLVVGCVASVVPPPATNFLSGGNRLIAESLERAAADWARHGLELANYVTVDDEGAGLPVSFVATDVLQAESGNTDPSTVIDASTVFRNGKWVHLWVDEFFRDKPEDLQRILTHELVHALVPRAPHLDGAPGIYTAKKSSALITRADMEHLSRYTEVGPSEVPFEGEPA